MATLKTKPQMPKGKVERMSLCKIAIEKGSLLAGGFRMVDLRALAMSFT
jgi:hypothetical protein